MSARAAKVMKERRREIDSLDDAARNVARAWNEFVALHPWRTDVAAQKDAGLLVDLALRAVRYGWPDNVKLVRSLAKKAKAPARKPGKVERMRNFVAMCSVVLEWRKHRDTASLVDFIHAGVVPYPDEALKKITVPLLDRVITRFGSDPGRGRGHLSTPQRLAAELAYETRAFGFPKGDRGLPNVRRAFKAFDRIVLKTGP